MTRHPTLTATVAVAACTGAAYALWRHRPDLHRDPWVNAAVADVLFLVGFGTDELLRRDGGP